MEQGTELILIVTDKAGDYKDGDSVVAGRFLDYLGIPYQSIDVRDFQDSVDDLPAVLAPTGQVFEGLSKIVVHCREFGVEPIKGLFPPQTEKRGNSHYRFLIIDDGPESKIAQDFMESLGLAYSTCDLTGYDWEDFQLPATETSLGTRYFGLVALVKYWRAIDLTLSER